MPGRGFPIEGKEWVRVENIRQTVKRVWGYDALFVYASFFEWTLHRFVMRRVLGNLCLADDPSGHRG